MINRADLANLGFEGFIAVRLLRASRLTEVPAIPGVYAFLRPDENPPTFLPHSPAGHYKSRNPTVPVDLLERKGVLDTNIIYIGKAGSLRKPPTLRKRLQQYLSAGAGKSGHWGGRYIWQLADAEDLLVCWRPLADVDPESIEADLLARFESKHGRLPFANLKRGATPA